LYPTWEGLLAQAAALAFVLGSYVAAEALRARRRARILAAPIGSAERLRSASTNTVERSRSAQVTTAERSA
jgi:hypothetical protein